MFFCIYCKSYCHPIIQHTFWMRHVFLILCSPNVHCFCCKQKKGSAACAGRGLIVLQVCVLFMCGCGKLRWMSNLVFHTPCTLACRGISRETYQKKVTLYGGLLQAKPVYTFLYHCVFVSFLCAPLRMLKNNLISPRRTVLYQTR